MMVAVYSIGDPFFASLTEVVLSWSGNVLVTMRGLLTAQELSPGDKVLGLDRKRELSFGELAALGQSEPTTALLVLTSSGESVLRSSTLLPSFGGRRTVLQVFEDQRKQDICVERLPVIAERNGADCGMAGCVARMYSLLRVNHETEELRFRHERAFSKQTKQELYIRNGTQRGWEFYMRAKYDIWSPEALFHSGFCRGYELLSAFGSDRRIPIQYTAARQAQQFYKRAQQEIPEIGITHGYAPLYVSMSTQDTPKVDRIRGVLFMGDSPTVNLSFVDKQFSPIVGTIPSP